MGEEILVVFCLSNRTAATHKPDPPNVISKELKQID